MDWETLPKSKDDGGLDHFVLMNFSDLAEDSTNGRDIHLSTLGGFGVLYAYPLTAGAGGGLA